MSNKQEFNKRFKQPKDQSNSKQDISRLTGISMKILDEVISRGHGAWESSPSSVRRVKGVKMSKERWGYSRLYSFVNKMTGSKELNHDLDLAEKIKKQKQKQKREKNK